MSSSARKDNRVMLRLTEEMWRQIKFFADVDGRSDQDQVRWFIATALSQRQRRQRKAAGGRRRQQLSASVNNRQQASA